MKRLILGFFIITCQAWAQDKYYGAKSTEAMLYFDGFIEVATQRSLTIEKLKSSTPKALEVKQAIDHQLSFLIGHFQSESFLENFKFPGTLSDRYKIHYLSVEPRFQNHQIIHYRFEGKVVFQTEAFKKSDHISLPLRIPKNPKTIYELGKVRGINQCTDKDYNSIEDFFYFWDPDKMGCPLKNNATDIIRLDGLLKKIPNTYFTYPEYDRLYFKPELKISIFVGYIQTDSVRDDGFKTYKELKQYFRSLGFTIILDKKIKEINFESQFEKEIRNQLGIKQKISVTLLLSDSESGVSDKTFANYFSEALRNSDIVSYDGHSGLGGNLDVIRLRIEKLPSFYQIFFFNACSSYSYYNSMYFSLKPGGKRNLDIITAGLPTITSTSVTNMTSFLSPFINGKIHSYQTILRSLERSNDGVGTYLMGVSGDEDNVFKPEGGPGRSLPEIN
jgi:hypothetical protein